MSNFTEIGLTNGHYLLHLKQHSGVVMAENEEHSWHDRLFVWSYAAFDQKPPNGFDVWLYSATVLGAIGFLICAFVICIVLNIGTIPFGVFAEPIWRTDARFRRLAFPGGIPIISIAAPIWVALAAWHNWIARGALYALGPFVTTTALAFTLLGCFVLFNRLRRKSPRLSFRGSRTGANN